MTADNSAVLLERASTGITAFLRNAAAQGLLDQKQSELAMQQVLPNMRKWLADPHIDALSPALKQGIREAIEQERWEDIVNSFHRSVRFGTGGIRTMMAFDRPSIVRLKEEGIGAPILKGPNTINDLVLLLTSAGVAKFGRAQAPQPFSKIVIGYDSRIRGADFATIVARLFLAYGYTVYFFDEACPYPEVTFAIPHDSIKADLGVFISASHNDYRYNGYKLSCGNGSQFAPRERAEMYDKYIAKAEPKDIILCPFREAPAGRLVFLGGDRPLDGVDYAGRDGSIIDIHRLHREHVKSFMLTPDLDVRQRTAAKPLGIAYCAFHGAGRRAVPRLLKEVGFRDVKTITKNGLNDLDGLFPSFSSTPGREQQPDPGDPRAADVAVGAFQSEYPGAFETMDILIGTDPDADRCGVVSKVPPNQRHLFDNRDYALLPADDLWALILWYRMYREIQEFGSVRDADKKFVVMSHTTSDSITRLAMKHGIGLIKTWVGFPTLAAGAQTLWDLKTKSPDEQTATLKQINDLVDGRSGPKEGLSHDLICQCYGINAKRSINVAALEQSNGFSILGGRPKDESSLGLGGHVRDKDGTFAALLVAEVAAWAKERGLSLLELIDREIYCDPDVGLFATVYEPDPLYGEYPGIEGDRIKLAILRRALAAFQLALAGDLVLGGRPVKSACIYRTGKYDAIYPPTYDFAFPDEGIRFFFDAEKLNHVTVRPSGTGNSLRFHIQLHAVAAPSDLVQKKEKLNADARRIMDDVRAMLKAPRQQA